jgi:hypothetical protein
MSQDYGVVVMNSQRIKGDYLDLTSGQIIITSIASAIPITITIIAHMLN